MGFNEEEMRTTPPPVWIVDVQCRLHIIPLSAPVGHEVDFKLFSDAVPCLVLLKGLDDTDINVKSLYLEFVDDDL